MQDTIKKFKFKDTGIVINAPTTIENEFIKIGFTTKFERQKSANTLIFIIDNNSL